ncbi:MAG: hypothetical protein ACR2MD_18570 [Aridibacter sp.]|jgi:hypothetical protein|nr:hypothetical protein [Acidobacteriota bacterium]
MRFIALLHLLIIFNFACSSNKNAQADSLSLSPKSAQDFPSNKIKSDADEIKETKVNSKDNEVDENNQRKTSIRNTIGLITLSDKYPTSDKKINRDDFIRFYNEDGSLWYEFTFYYYDSDGKFEYENDDFRVFSFHPDYFLLSLRCVSEDKNRYEVIVNEETGLKKYVRKNDKNLKLISWENYILKTFSIDLKKAKNKVFETPNGKEIKPNFAKIDRFEAVEIKGDWLKVKWEIPNEKEKFEAGWVRWKNDSIILIDWFNLA